MYFLLGPTATGQLSWLGWLDDPYGIDRFSVSLIDQLFQPTRNPDENDRYRTAITILGSYPLCNVNKRHLV